MAYNVLENSSITFLGKDIKGKETGNGTHPLNKVTKSFAESTLGIFKGNQWSKGYADNLAFFESRLNESFDVKVDFIHKAETLIITVESLEDGYKTSHKTQVTAKVEKDPLKADYRKWVIDLRSFTILQRGEVKPTAKKAETGESADLLG